MECPSIFRCLQFLSANSRQWNELWPCELSCILQVWMFMIPKSPRVKLHRYQYIGIENWLQLSYITGICLLSFWRNVHFPHFGFMLRVTVRIQKCISHSQDRAKFLCQWAGGWDFSLISMHLSTWNLVFQSLYFLLAVKKKNKLISRCHPPIILTITNTFAD